MIRPDVVVQTLLWSTFLGTVVSLPSPAAAQATPGLSECLDVQAAVNGGTLHVHCNRIEQTDVVLVSLRRTVRPSNGSHDCTAQLLEDATLLHDRKMSSFPGRKSRPARFEPDGGELTVMVPTDACPLDSLVLPLVVPPGAPPPPPAPPGPEVYREFRERCLSTLGRSSNARPGRRNPRERPPAGTCSDEASDEQSWSSCYSLHTATTCFIVGEQGAYGWDPDDPHAPLEIPEDPCELLDPDRRTSVRNTRISADRFRASRVLHPHQPVNVVVATCNNYRYVVSVSGSASDGLARIDAEPESATTPVAGSVPRQYTSAPFTVFPRTAGQMVVGIEAGPSQTAWGKPNEGPRASHLTHVEYVVERRYMASFRLGMSVNTGPLGPGQRSYGTREIDGQRVIRREHEPRTELVLAFVPNVFSGLGREREDGRPRHLLYRDSRRFIPEPFIGVAVVSSSPFRSSDVEFLSAIHVGLDMHLTTGMGLAGGLRFSQADVLRLDYQPGQVVAPSERFTDRRIATSLSFTLNVYPAFFNIGGGSK